MSSSLSSRPARTGLTVRALVAVTALGLAVGLAACGKASSAAAPDDSPSASTGVSTTPPALPDTWPLSGLPVAEGDSSTKGYNVLFAKVPNTEDAEPQHGVDKADLVFQELVEGGITRLAVGFYSDLPGKVGPIRSGRHSDVGILQPAGAELVLSGAAAEAYDWFAQNGITLHVFDHGDPYVVRKVDGEHDYLHSVVADIAGIAANEAQTADHRPDDYFDFATQEWALNGDQWELRTEEFPGVDAGPGFSDTFAAGNTSTWAWADGHYTLTDGHMAKDEQYTPDTVLVVKATAIPAPYKSPTGGEVPFLQFYGDGDGYIFHGGKVLEVTWHKDDWSSQMSFTDKATGQRVGMPRGKIWVDLMSTDGVVDFQAAATSATPAQ